MLQIDTINNFMMIKVELDFWEFWETKLGQTNSNFLYALLQRIISNFYSWINSSCFTKTLEHNLPIKLILIPSLGYLVLKLTADSKFEPRFDFLPR
jgi:hypothetical protein